MIVNKWILSPFEKFVLAHLCLVNEIFQTRMYATGFVIFGDYYYCGSDFEQWKIFKAYVDAFEASKPIPECNVEKHILGRDDVAGGGDVGNKEYTNKLGRRR